MNDDKKYTDLSEKLSDYWNTRIIKHTITHKFDDKLQYDETYYGIHEVYYDKEDEPIMWSEEQIKLIFEDKEEFEILLKQILEAKDRTILEKKDKKLIDTNTKL